MNILAIDQGNTTIAIGYYQNDILIKKEFVRIFNLSDGEYTEKADEILSLFASDTYAPEYIGISSSSPRRLSLLKERIASFFDIPVVLINPDSNMDVKIAGSDAKSAGPDLICAGQAVYSRYGGNILIVSLGTATTLSYLSDDGVLESAVICPGIGIMVKALRSYLPHISPEFSIPDKILCCDTAQCVNSGIFWGHICMLEGLIARIKKELGREFKVVVCGGYSCTVRDLLVFADAQEPDIVLDGVRILCEKNI